MPDLQIPDLTAPQAAFTVRDLLVSLAQALGLTALVFLIVTGWSLA